MREVATMVPVRSLMMIRAGMSASTSNDSTCEMNSTGELAKPAGICTRTVVESSAWALSGNFSLTAAERRAAEVK